jgi:hypothetical protein
MNYEKIQFEREIIDVVRLDQILWDHSYTNFDKEDILANHKSFMSSLNIPINEENCELSTL